MTDTRPILLVEDNADDQLLTRIAFKRSNILNRLIIVDDGEAALDFLLARNASAGRSDEDMPAVVLMDINLPGMNGFEILGRIRAAPEICRLPVIMLTSSDRDEDVVRAYDSGVNAYLRKPVEMGEFIQVISQFHLFWMVMNRNPR